MRRWFRRRGTPPGELAFESVTYAIGPLDEIAERVPGYPELLGRREGVAFVELAPEVEQELDPWFMLGAHEPDIFQPRRYRVPPARLYRFAGGTDLYGKGLILRGGDLVALDDLKFQQLGRLDYPFHREVVRREGGEAIVTRPTVVREIDEPCILLAQCGEVVWGHWLVDLLPRLPLALTLPIPARVILDVTTPPWSLPMLARFGIDPARVVWHDAGREVLRVRDLYLPTFLRGGNAFSPLANLAWQLFQGAPVAPASRLYVSRRRLAAGSSVSNAEQVERLVRQRGYRVVHPETMTLDEQVSVFSQARLVVGEYGSALHNTVFSPALTRVAVLQPPDHPWFVQSGIGQVRAQPTGLAFGDPDGAARRIRVSPELLGAVLDRLEAG